MLPVVETDRKKRLPELSTIFGRKAWVVEVALDWAIEKGIPPDPAFRPETQIHVHLSKDYRAIPGENGKPKYSAADLGAFLHTAIGAYYAHRDNGHTGPLTLWERAGISKESYWSIEVPDVVLRSVRARAFANSRTPDAEFADLLRASLETVRARLPDPPSPRTVYIPYTRSLLDLYNRTSEACDKLELDLDTLLVDTFVTNEKKRAL